jgi:hypothetical protein
MLCCTMFSRCNIPKTLWLDVIVCIFMVHYIAYLETALYAFSMVLYSHYMLFLALAMMHGLNF